MQIMSRLLKQQTNSFHLAAGVFLLAAAFFALLPQAAFADVPAGATVVGCNASFGMNAIFCTLAEEFRSTPKLLSIFSMVGAVVLGFTALLNLKEYGDDPSKVPLRGIVVKLVLCVLLITLPFVMRVFINSMTGGGITGNANLNRVATAPKSHGGSL